MQDNNGISRHVSTRELVWILVLLIGSTGLLIGCDNRPESSEVVGSVVFRGRPVYPAVIMLKGNNGKSYTAKLTAKGEFRVFEVEKGKYQIAIETIKLGNSGAKISTANADSAPKDESGFPNREMMAPPQYRNANVRIPRKYNSFDTSGLEIDCSETYPLAPVELKLEK